MSNATVTQPRPHHTRADSGVGNIVPESENLAEIQNLWETISSLSNTDGFAQVENLIRKVSLQDDERKRREEEIQDLNAKALAKQKSYEAHQQEQLSQFEARYRQWDEKTVALQSKVKGLTEISEENDELIKRLRKELAESRGRVEDLEKAVGEMTKRLKDKDQQLVEIDKRLDTTQKTSASYFEKLREANENVAALQRSLDGETANNRTLQSDTEKLTGKLDRFRQFSVKMRTLDLPQMANEIDNLWVSIATLIASTIGQDLPVGLLQSNWTKLRDNDVFKPQIPLPQSNSKVAKQMRVAKVLASLASLAYRYLFQPTYLLEETSGLRGILRKEATVNPQKEMYIRGILHSMCPSDQEIYAEERLEFIVEDLLEAADVQVLLPAASLDTFSRDLRDLMKGFQEQWKLIQQARQKLEPSFAPNPTGPDQPWLVLNAGAAMNEMKVPSPPLTTENVQDGIVIVPRIFHIKHGGATPDPITSGCVLQKAHMDAAAGEIRKGLPGTPFTEKTSNRSRNRPGRSLSTATIGALNGHRGRAS